MIERICENCGKSFKTYPCYIERGKRNGTKEGRFCSHKCGSIGKFNGRYNGGLEKVYFECLHCKKTFDRTVSELKNIYLKFGKRPVYCSKKCQDLHRGIIYRGENAPAWKGGRRIHCGYVNIYKPEHPFANTRKEVSEHRLILEEKLGRYLTKNEVAHHINGVKSDNRINNLQLLTKSQHSIIHDKMKERKRNVNSIKNLIPYMKSKGYKIKILK